MQTVTVKAASILMVNYYCCHGLHGHGRFSPAKLASYGCSSYDLNQNQQLC